MSFYAPFSYLPLRGHRRTAVPNSAQARVKAVSQHTLLRFFTWLCLMMMMAGAFASLPASAQNSNFELLKALDRLDEDEVVSLLRKGTNPDTRRRISKEPALIIAVKLKHTGMVTALLDAGANVNSKDPEHGETALMLRAIAGDTAMAKLLLDRGADPNAVDDGLETALIKAVRSRKGRMVALLLENGANPSVQDLTGTTALMYARNSRNRGIVTLLEKAGAEY